MQQHQPQTLSVQQLAERWQVHVNTVRRQIRTGDIPKPIKIGNQFRFPIQAIEGFERGEVG